MDSLDKHARRCRRRRRREAIRERAAVLVILVVGILIGLTLQATGVLVV